MKGDMRFMLHRIPKPALGLFGIFLALAVVGTIVIVKKYRERPVEPETPKTAATVNGEEIRTEDFEYRYQSQLTFYTEVYPRATNQTMPDKFLRTLPQIILDDMVMDVLLSQYLEEKGIVVREEDVRQYVQTVVVDPLYGGDWQKYEAYLTENKTDLAIALSHARRDVLVAKVIDLEHISNNEFGDWYKTLRENNQITIQLESY